MMGALEGIFGKGSVSVDGADCLAYSSDSSQAEGKARAIVWPTSREQVAMLVREAVKSNWDIVPRGGGSGMAGGCVPNDSIIVDMSMMDSIGSLDTGRRTVVAGPGTILDDLNSLAGEHGLVFPVNPTSHMACSIGGMVATDAAGNREMRYGKTSDWVEELEIIDGRGRAVTLKGREARDFAGTEGILGIITGIKLRLTEPPAERSLSVMRFSEPKGLIEKAAELRSEGNALSVEFFDRMTARLSGLEDAHHLFVEYGSLEGEIRGEEGIRKGLKAREGIGTVLSSNGYVLMEDPRVPLDRMHEFMGWLEESGIPHFGHIAMGIIHQRFSEDTRKKIPEMHRLVQSLGGSVSGEHGIGIRKKDYLDAGRAGALRALKKRYDPHGVMNRGKMI